MQHNDVINDIYTKRQTQQTTNQRQKEMTTEGVEHFKGTSIRKRNQEKEKKGTLDMSRKDGTEITILRHDLCVRERKQHNETSSLALFLACFCCFL